MVLKHKIDGPAYIEYNRDGELWKEIWYQNDMKHRIDGPAAILYSDKKKSIHRKMVSK